MRLIDAEPIEKYIEDGLNCKDPQKRFGHDAIEILTEVHYAPTIDPPPNDALTLEQLREMDGEPVWITPSGFWALVIARSGERVKLISNDGEVVFADKEIELVGPVYRRKPEKGEKTNAG